MFSILSVCLWKVRYRNVLSRFFLSLFGVENGTFSSSSYDPVVSRPRLNTCHKRYVNSVAFHGGRE